MNVNESPDNEPELPPEIEAALAEEIKVEAFVSPERDRSILAAAHAELELPEARILRPRFRPGRWLAAAAAIALCFTVLHRSNRQFSEPPVAQPSPTDFNGDATVDILDVMLLAKRIEANDKPAGGDINGDGAIDQADVDALAANLVRLENPM